MTTLYFSAFEVAGRDGPGGGVIPEHLHRYNSNIIILYEKNMNFKAFLEVYDN